MAAALPLNAQLVGYRFSPTDEELVNHYLQSKINGNEEAVSCIPVVDLCGLEPRELPGMSQIETNANKWFFFCRKYRNGKRQNRATRAGYWKATGRDRSIKSVKGTTVIGTKKTLVFHTGRSPNGQRTNWVIHEYCATSEELHGTNPGQGSFALIKLIKKHDEKLDRKQDESTEGLNRNEVDENVSSSAIVISELVTPTMTVQAEELPFNSESGLVENSESFQDSCVADDLDFLLGPLADLEQPDCLSKICSPLHLQMQPDLESMHTLHCPVFNDEFQYGTNDQDINEYLASVLVEDSVVAEMMAPKSICVLRIPSEDTGSCSEPDEETAQAQFDPEQFEQNNERKAPVFMAMPAGAYKTPDISNEEHLSNFRELSDKEGNHEAKLVVAKAEEAEEKYSATADPAAIIDETQDTSLSKSIDVTKVAQEPTSNMKSDFPRGCDKEAPPALQSIPSCKHMLVVLLAVGLPIVIMGLWRSLEFST